MQTTAICHRWLTKVLFQIIIKIHLCSDYVLDSRKEERNLTMIPLVRAECEHDDLICVTPPQNTSKSKRECLENHQGAL